MIDRETEGGRGRDRAKEWDSRMGESPMREGGRRGYWKSFFIVLTAKFLTMSIVLQQEKHSTERLVQLIPYYTVLHCSAL